jgi:hypothetical protein
MNSYFTFSICKCRVSNLLTFQHDETCVSAVHFFASSVLLTDRACFSRDSITNIHNKHQWAEENPYGVNHSRQQQQFSINVSAGTAGDWYVCMFCHVGLQATTTKISSYMIHQSYQKMYHWKSEHKCGICMMVLQHILATTCKMFSVTPTAWPPSLPDLNPLDFYLWGHL